MVVCSYITNVNNLIALRLLFKERYRCNLLPKIIFRFINFTGRHMITKAIAKDRNSMFMCMVLSRIHILQGIRQSMCVQ